MLSTTHIINFNTPVRMFVRCVNTTLVLALRMNLKGSEGEMRGHYPPLKANANSHMLQVLVTMAICLSDAIL